MKSDLPNSTKRPFNGRLVFLISLLFLSLGVWRASSSRLAVWSHSLRHGEWTALAAVAGAPVLAGLYDDRVSIGALPQDSAMVFPRPMRLVDDGQSGLFVIGLLSNRIGRISADGHVRPDTELPVNCYLTGILADGDKVWMTGYYRHRIPNQPKQTIYMPEYGRYRWFVVNVPLEVPSGRLQLPADQWVYDNEIWHDESGGVWFLLSTERNLLIVNDQAETVTCIRKTTGEILWRSDTAPRPNSALLWGDELIVSSGQAGVLDFFNLQSGKRQRRIEVAKGITDMAWYNDELVTADWQANRLLGINPGAGEVRTIRSLSSGPRLLAVQGEELWVALAAVNRVTRLDRSYREIGHWDWNKDLQP